MGVILKINLEKDTTYSGCYDADNEQWDVYTTDPKAIPVDLFLSQDGESYWNCYLVKAQYMRKQNQYHLVYKDY